jgi:glycosyltransferase involved in cell wall biosynthesis
MKILNVVIVSHKFLTQPDDELVNFLNQEKFPNVIHITHSFSDAKDRVSKFKWYKEGKLFQEKIGRDFINYPEILIYFKEFLFTFLTIIKTNLIWDKYIGMDGLCVFFGIFLKKFNKVKDTIFWVIDFVPNNRFDSKIKNFVYSKINIFGYKNAEELWDLSPRMHEARNKFLHLKLSDYKKHKIVPYGVWWEKIKRYSYEECQKNTLVFMGHLLEKQGVQFIIKALPSLIKEIPNFKFKIIGTGNYKENLEKLAREIGVEKNCHFLGKIENHKELQEEIAKSTISIAPYSKKHDTWTYYADPGKVKEYLACGVPLLLTDIPWNAKEIDSNKCGFIISLEPTDIKNHIIKLLNPVINKKYRDNAVKYSKIYDYSIIFKRVLDN